MKLDEKLNKLALQYITNGNTTEDFVKCYKVYDKIWRNKYEVIARYDIRNFDPADVCEQYEKVFKKTLDAYKPSMNIPFTPFLRKNLNRKMIDMIEKQKTQQKYLHTQTMKPKKEEDEEHDVLLLVKSPTDVEEMVITNMTKKSDTEKKELTSFFRASTSDPLTLQAMDLFYEEDELGNPKYENLHQIAKKLGIQQTQLIRRFEKIRKAYDTNRFGQDYYAYMM